MKKIVSNTVFDKNDSNSVSFYEDHGWVVIKNVFSQENISNLNLQWQNMTKQYSKELNVSIEEYMTGINQWRDLWLHGGSFKDVIFNKNGIQLMVKKTMNWKGVQLLHDHIIAKPLTNNDKIPWHQDSMFWPVDMAGCSSWTALQDVSVDSGCLEVLDCSHKDGCQNPVDFMEEEKRDFESNYKHLQLPIKSGETIILHSLTWHRSSPNTNLKNRAAHIALWVHPTTNWRPDLVDWHPINEFVESKPKEYIRGSQFPYFGEVEVIEKPDNWHAGTKTKSDRISMFDSSKIIGRQLSKILNKSDDISSLLSSDSNRKIVIEKTIEAGICQDREKLSEVLNKLWLSHAAYKKNQSRNVFNSAYSQWWDIAGTAWDLQIKENEK